MDGTRTRAENAHEATEITEGCEPEREIESPRVETVGDRSQRVVTTGGAESEPTDTELERGILDAVKLGAVDVARTLSARLDDRRRVRVPNNVVDYDTERSKRRP